ncbi:MAG: hypothetical protein JO327_07265 [Nitrososphaeraceae archaeon]|nr:hypothetical protein [Nitrososphaeraceae archaeon]
MFRHTIRGQHLARNPVLKRIDHHCDGEGIMSSVRPRITSTTYMWVDDAMFSDNDLPEHGIYD